MLLGCRGWAQSPEAQKFLLNVYRQHGATDPRPQFRLLFVVQDRRTGRDESLLRQLFGRALRMPEWMLRRVCGAALGDLIAAGSVNGPVWLSGADLVDQTADVLGQPRRKQFLALRQLLHSVPRHSLFPGVVK